MPKATQNATQSDRQARALRMAHDYLAGELKKAKRGEAATVTPRRARTAMNAIEDALEGMGAPSARRRRKPPGISRGELVRSVLRDLRESGAWSTAADLAQSVAVMHRLRDEQSLCQRLEERISKACGSLERDGCLVRDTPLTPGYVPTRPRWQLAD